MDDELQAVMEMQLNASLGNFWELRAARLKGTAQGDIAAVQAEQFADMLTTEAIFEPEPEQPRKVLS